MANDYGTMEAKWQARWAEAGLDMSDRDESKPKDTPTSTRSTGTSA